MAQIRLLLDYDPFEATQAEADQQVRRLAQAALEQLRRDADMLPGVSVCGWDVDLIQDPNTEARLHREGWVAILAMAELHHELLEVQQRADTARAGGPDVKRDFYGGFLAGHLTGAVRGVLSRYYAKSGNLQAARNVGAIELFGPTEREKAQAATTA